MAKLQLKKELGGYRYYLDGRGVHAGDFLEIKIRGNWKLARYEWTYRRQDPSVIYLDENPARIFPEVDEFRWPC